MMKAEVTAENRPACDTDQYARVSTACTTYEYERCVEILLVFLYEFLVVLSRLLAVMFVEFVANIVPWRHHILFLPV